MEKPYGSPPLDTLKAIVVAQFPTSFESLEFIEMAELLSERLSFDAGDDEAAKNKSKKLAHYFSLCIAMISQKQPSRVPDLLGYQLLISDAHSEFKWNYWMDYDRRFRQKAAAMNTAK